MPADANEVYIDHVLTKKSIHFSLKTGTHAGFKSACAERSLSMQEVIEEFAFLISQGDTDMIGFIDKIQKEKLLGVKKEKKLQKRQTEDIYAILERENPLNNDLD